MNDSGITVDSVCVCCQERLLIAAFETQCCLLPVCDDCWGIFTGKDASQTFTCPNCSTLTNPIPKRLAILAWFRDQLSQAQASQQKLLKSYFEQLQSNQQYHCDHLNAATTINNSLVTAFSTSRSDLAEVKAQLSQISQATTKSLTLTRNDYLIVQKQLLRLGQILQYLTRVTESADPTLDHLDQLLLIQQRLSQTPIPNQQSPLNLTLVSHRYGLSVYLDNFQTKLNHCRAAVLKLPLQSPLRTIAWPNAATWLELIGVNHPSKYFAKDTVDFEVAEWPQAGYFSYIFECKTMRTYLAVTISPVSSVSQVETVRYPEKPKGYHEIALTPFWLIWLDAKTNQVFYHRGLTGLANQPRQIKPAKVIDLAICQDPKSTTQLYNDRHLVNDDYFYINTVTGLWRKYLPDDSAPVWFSPITNVRQFYYGWYMSLDYQEGGLVSTVGHIGWDGQVLHQEVVEGIDTVRICNANTVSIRYKYFNRDSIYFFHTTAGVDGTVKGAEKFLWPGKMSQVGYFKITTQGDFMVLDEKNNIVFY